MTYYKSLPILISVCIVKAKFKASALEQRVCIHCFCGDNQQLGKIINMSFPYFRRYP